MRKLLLTLLFAAVTMLAARAEMRYQGDINLDGSVDGNDVSIMLEMVLSGGVSNAQMAVADLNTDGSVDGNDVSILLEIVLMGSPTPLYEYRTFTVAGAQFTMVKVPGGSFTMGATAEQGSDANSDESPTHSVTLSEYMIGQTEVTQELWEAVMGSNPSNFSGSGLPVEMVSWYDCQTFVTRLSALTGESFRLPTEAEWEYAARGGKSGGTKYAGSSTIADVAWYGSNSSSKTHPVATKLPNALWLYDMSGNVQEWCQDWYSSYSSAEQTNPQGPALPGAYPFRMCRGGGYRDAARQCRVSNRSYNNPETRTDILGLRLAIGEDPSLHSYTVNGVTFKMKEVPGGSFTMGATSEQESEADSNERPIHSVTLSSYMIGQTEVTQELWTAVMGSNPSNYNFLDPKAPVEHVDWYDCQTFIAKLNALTGETFRLPTEAEWEYAARGGVSYRVKYAGSNDIDDVAWYSGNASDTPRPVATKQPNAFGLFDMSGNVWEWCLDCSASYTYASQTNPYGSGSGSYRVCRGGSHYGDATDCRVSRRNFSYTKTRLGDLGLRLAIGVDPSLHSFTVKGVTFKMKELPGGTFTMGATSEQGSDAYNDENPTHSVTLSSFWIGQTEVTQELWTAVMGSNPSNFSGSNLPVEMVSWDDCQTFITKLNALTGETFRLPTEAEWEFAARGGTKYAGSDIIGDVAWYSGNSSWKTHPVATKQANVWGLFDMSGNVWEWCQDWFGNYSASGQADPQGPTSGTGRVYRGGSWGVAARVCRVSARSSAYPTSSGSGLGLRLAR